MQEQPLTEIEIWKGNLGGSWQARRNVQLARDGKLVADVNKWKVTTRELGAALLGLPRTPAYLKIVERRYNRLAKDKLHQVSLNGITYNVTLQIPKSKVQRAQIEHRYMEALAASTLLRAAHIQEYLSGQQLFANDKQ